MQSHIHLDKRRPLNAALMQDKGNELREAVSNQRCSSKWQLIRHKYAYLQSSHVNNTRSISGQGTQSVGEVETKVYVGVWCTW